MPKKSTKSKSKRMTLRQKHKIIRKVKDHQRKKRKELKKLEAAGRGKKKTLKDPGIPSQWPFKDQFIAEMQAKRLDILAQEQAKKDAKKARKLAARAAAENREMEEVRVFHLFRYTRSLYILVFGLFNPAVASLTIIIVPAFPLR